MLRTPNSVVDILPYDIWLEIFSYFSFTALFNLDRLPILYDLSDQYGPSIGLSIDSPDTELMHLVTTTNLRTKCTLRLVSKEFSQLTNSIFYEALLFKKWGDVTDLATLLERDPLIRETLSRSTKRIDFPFGSKGEHGFDAAAALLLDTCPNVTHLSYSVGQTHGFDFLERMRTMDFSSKLRFLNLMDSHCDMIIPYLQHFPKLETFLLSWMSGRPDLLPVPSTKIHMPRLRALNAPHSECDQIRDHIIEAPLLEPSSGILVPPDQSVLWAEYGPQMRTATLTYKTDSFLYSLKYFGNLQSLTLSFELWFVFREHDDYDIGAESFVFSKLEELAITSWLWFRLDGDGGESMEMIFKILSRLLRKGAIPNLKRFKIDAVGFRVRTWETVPRVSRAWLQYFSERGIQLMDEEGVLGLPDV